MSIALYKVLRSTVLVSLLLHISGQAIAQENKTYDINNTPILMSNYFFDEQLYPLTSSAHDGWIEQPHAPQFPPHQRRSEHLELNKRIADLRLEVAEAEYKMAEFIAENHPKPITTFAKIELGSFYYNSANYPKAIEYFELMDIDRLEENDMSEVSLKKGYAHFILREYDKAIHEFDRTKELRNDYYEPINYYHGVCYFLKNDFGQASESFKKTANSTQYAPYIPYYLSQIYFKQKEYEKLISYAEQKITESSTKNKKDIRLLLGQAYFIRSDYERALNHLSYYEQETELLTVEEFYQLAFTQYKLGKYKDAKANFLELTNEDSKLGQMANYYLADCYLRLEDKVSARSAFKKVSQMQYEKTMSEESTFNYGKLSAAMGLDREAVHVLVDIPKSSPYYDASQVIVFDLLNNSADYQNSIELIKSLKNPTPKLKLAQQNLTLKLAYQKYLEQKYTVADSLFRQSEALAMDATMNTKSKFWRAMILHRTGDYNASIKAFDTFIKASKNESLPILTSEETALYYQGFNYWKLKEYGKAVTYFEDAATALSKQEQTIGEEAIKDQVIPDANLKTADCYLYLKNYYKANLYYEKVVKSNKGNFVYARFQDAMVSGLLGFNDRKAEKLQDLIAKYPNTNYTDVSMFQLGETYMAMQNEGEALNAYVDLMSTFSTKSPYYNDAQLRLGLIFYHKADWNKSLSYYKSVIGFNPTEAQRQEALNSIKEIYIKSLVQPNAYTAYLDSIPGYALSDIGKDSLAYTVGQNLYNDSNYDKAIPQFSSYLSTYPNGLYRLESQYYRAESYTLLKKYDLAARDYEAVVQYGNSRFLEPSLYKAAIIQFEALQDYKKSYDFLVALESLKTSETDLYNTRLLALKAAYNAENSKGVLTYAVKVNNDSLATNTDKAMALFYLGKTQLAAKDLEAAKAAFAQVDVMADNVQAAEARYLQAKILFDQEKYDVAENQCNYANEKSASHPYWVAKSLILLSDIYVVKKDYLNAKAALEAVIENFSEDNVLLSTSQEKLAAIKQKESSSNRVKKPGKDFELDTTQKK